VTDSAKEAVARQNALIVAIGNPDRGDDGVAALVAAKLSGRLAPEVGLLRCRGDVLSLIEEWSGLEALVLIDAAAPNGAPGRILRIDLSTGELPRDTTLPSSHAFGLADTIALARALRRLPETAIVYTIEGLSFGAGVALTPEVAAAAEDVARRVAAEGCLCRGRERVVSHA
jgi:hydrogenase maturation protease